MWSIASGMTNPTQKARDNRPGLPNSLMASIAPYALAMSGKTASILVFSVAALNGLTM